MQSLKRLTVLCLTVLSIGCSSFEVADVGPIVTLPASGDCYRVRVLSKKKTRYPKAECDEMKKRAIFLTSEDYFLQRTATEKNCQFAKCKQLMGAFDELFLTVDAGLRKIPMNGVLK